MKTFINYPNGTEVVLDTATQDNTVKVTACGYAVNFIAEHGMTQEDTKTKIHVAFMNCEESEVRNTLNKLRCEITQWIPCN